MKRFIAGFLFVILLLSGHKSCAQFETTIRTTCIDFIYLGFVKNPATGYVTLSFEVVNKCNTDLSYVAFQLADTNLKLITNTANIKGDIYTSSKKRQYVIDDMKNGGITNNPFRSVKYNSVTGYKNNASDIFTFTVSSDAIFSVSSLWVEAKGGSKSSKGFLETVNFVPGSSRNGDLILLPVELTRFEAKVTAANQVALTWATATEKNNEYFAVERSRNGIDFTQIGQVKGNGTSVQINMYSFIDQKSVTGTVYYRLKQVDFDSKFEYSKIEAVTVKGTPAMNITVYPNPAAQQISIDLAGNASELAAVKIIGLNGRVYKTINLISAPQLTVPVQELPTGFYLVQVETAAGVSTKKFQKL